MSDRLSPIPATLPWIEPEISLFFFNPFPIMFLSSRLHHFQGHNWPPPCQSSLHYKVSSNLNKQHHFPWMISLFLLKCFFPTCCCCCCSVTKLCPTSLWPHGLQHARLPCPSLYLLEFAQTHVHRVSNAIQPSDPLSPPSPPALSFPQH